MAQTTVPTVPISSGLQNLARPERSLWSDEGFTAHRAVTAWSEGVLEAIRAKNPAKARRAMLEHLRAIGRNILKPSEGEEVGGEGERR